MTGLHTEAHAAPFVAEENWVTAPLIDVPSMQQWTEDLAAEQVNAILQRVPMDSRSNAAEIIAAVGRNDLRAARRQAHRLKGMAATIGAQRLAEIASDIEHGAQAGTELTAAMAALSSVLEDTLVAFAAIRMATEDCKCL